VGGTGSIIASNHSWQARAISFQPSANAKRGTGTWRVRRAEPVPVFAEVRSLTVAVRIAGSRARQHKAANGRVTPPEAAKSPKVAIRGGRKTKKSAMFDWRGRERGFVCQGWRPDTADPVMPTRTAVGRAPNVRCGARTLHAQRGDVRHGARTLHAQRGDVRHGDRTLHAQRGDVRRGAGRYHVGHRGPTLRTRRGGRAAPRCAGPSLPLGL
jgi:hypothetical protein